MAVESLRSQLRQLGVKLGYTTMEDWYKVTWKDFSNHNALHLLSTHPDLQLGKSHTKVPTSSNAKTYSSVRVPAPTVVMGAFPEHMWCPWLFNSVPNYFWHAKTNQQRFMQYLGEKKGFNDMDDWYTIESRDFNENGGAALLHFQYKSSPSEAVMSIFDNHEWLPWRFHAPPSSYWQDQSHQVKYLQYIGEKLGYKTMEDWYKISHQTLRSMPGGTSLLSYYNESPSALVMGVFKDTNHEWDLWKFNGFPAYNFGEGNIVQRFFKSLEQPLRINKLEDWYRVSIQQISKHGKTYFLTKLGGLIGALSVAYPHHNWEQERLETSSKRAAQRWLKIMLREILPPHVEIIEEHIFPGNTDPNIDEKTASQKKVTADIFIPEYGLAIDYNGPYHYKRGDTRVRKPDTMQIVDKSKTDLLSELGYKLVHIPYWWDDTPESLAATIHEHLPTGVLTQELLAKGVPISMTTAPKKSRKASRE